MVPDMPPGAGHALPAVSNPRAEPREMSGADARHEVNDTTGLVRRRKGRDMRRQAEIRCLDQVVLAGSPRAKPLPCGSPRRSGCFPMRRRSFWRASSPAALGACWWFIAFRVASPHRGTAAFVAAVGLAGLFAGLADLGAGNALIRLHRHVVVATWSDDSDSGHGRICRSSRPGGAGVARPAVCPLGTDCDTTSKWPPWSCSFWLLESLLTH